MGKLRGIADEEVTRLRLAARDGVTRSGLRAVAFAIGMSPSGLAKFIDEETQPYHPTVERLRRWYYQKAGMSHRPPADIAATLRDLMLLHPEPDRGVADLLSAVERSHADSGVRVPGWVAGVRAHIDR